MKFFELFTIFRWKKNIWKIRQKLKLKMGGFRFSIHWNDTTPYFDEPIMQTTMTDLILWLYQQYFWSKLGNFDELFSSLSKTFRLPFFLFIKNQNYRFFRALGISHKKKRKNRSKAKISSQNNECFVLCCNNIFFFAHDSYGFNPHFLILIDIDMWFF